MSELRKELSMEKEKCKKFQDDLFSSTDRETRMSKTIASVSIAKPLVCLRPFSPNFPSYHMRASPKYFNFFSYIHQVEQTKALLDGELKRAKQDLETSKSSSSFKLAKITAEFSELKKDRDKLKTQLDEEKLARETEVGNLKKKMATLEKAGLNAQKMNELKQNYTERISSQVS